MLAHYQNVATFAENFGQCVFAVLFMLIITETY